MSGNNLMQHNTHSIIFEREVAFKFKLFSSLFLNLPFKGVNEAGTLLTKFAAYCVKHIAQTNSNPINIIDNFFVEHAVAPTEIDNILFQFLRFIERQIVLFDALEDAAFSQLHDLNGAGSIDAFFNQVITSDQKVQQLEQILKYYKVRVVLTAHPTQFYPDQILGIIADLGVTFKQLDIDKIKSTFLQLGLTRFTNKSKPTPHAEALSLLWYLKNIFYHQLFLIQQKLPSEIINVELGFWPGGDRDGNPFVVADTTLIVAKKLRSTILRLYFVDLRELKQKLTFDGVYENLVEIADKVIKDKYQSANDLITDLNALKHTLQLHYQGLFVDLIDHMILKVRLFKFYFVKLDIRQNSLVHRNAIADILRCNNICDNYIDIKDNARLTILKKYLSAATLLDTQSLNSITAEVIQTFKAIHQIQHNNGIEAIERYIISNTNSMVHIFEVLFILKIINAHLAQSSLDNANQPIQINIVPLFETIDDLNHASLIMELLYQDADYMALLQQQNNRQTIMVGFSDGTKDGGYFMANWSIYTAKTALTKLSKKYNIDVVFFDGRGGPPSRGGGNTNNFYRSLGHDIATAELHLTIQGQTISSKFGNVESAQYNLEQLFTAGLFNKFFHNTVNTFNPHQIKILELLAQECYLTYLELKNDKLFMPYLEEITPLKYITDTNIGSRPAKRNQDGKIKFEDLRAIPFVGSWAQIKQNILGYYGLGTGLHNIFKTNPEYKAELKQLYITSDFFKSLIDNSLQSLLKSNFQVTQYLKHDVKFGQFWIKLYNETELTKKLLLDITGYKNLLDMDVVAQESIRMREEIILPLVVIQQYALSKIRSGATNTPINQLEKLIKKSLAANINASRNAV